MEGALETLRLSLATATGEEDVKSSREDGGSDLVVDPSRSMASLVRERSL